MGLVQVKTPPILLFILRFTHFFPEEIFLRLYKPLVNIQNSEMVYPINFANTSIFLWESGFMALITLPFWEP